MKKPKPFASEVELCAAFIAALPKGWTPYAETEGWDILLVRDADGFQIGIEAKLRLNADVLSQAIEEYGTIGVCSPGPDCRAVLVPHADAGSFDRIARYIGITVIRMTGPPASRYTSRGNLFHPWLPAHKNGRGWDEDWHEWCPAIRCRLPEYVPDVAAGSSAPVQLTPWKIAAIKLVILAETRGYVTRADFKHLGIDHRRWIHPNGWLRASERRGWYLTQGSPPTGLKEQHPRVYAEIVADAEKWMPKAAETGRLA